MADGQLKYEIGADLDKLNASLNEANDRIKYFAEQAASAGQKEIGKFNAELLRLKQYSDKLKNIGLPDNLPDNARKSRIALNDLNRVVQDLPFGFIAIQNNIPALVQSFGNLTAGEDGLKKGLKELGQSLIGPAGIFFAFSTITSIITVAIREFGSFGAAIEGIFGKVTELSKITRDAAKSQEELAKNAKTSGEIIAEATGSIDAQVTKVQTLAGVVTDLNKSEELRKNALSELQKINKAYFGDITTGIGDIDKLREATDKYTQSLLANAIAEGYRSQLSQAATNLEIQRNLLLEISKGFDDVAKKRKETQRGVVLGTSGQVFLETDLQLAKVIGSFGEQKKVVDEAVISVDKLKESYKNAILESLKFVEPIEKSSKATKDFKYEIEELIGALSIKTEISNIKDLADIILDVNKKSSERIGSLNKLKEYGNGVFNSLSIEKSGFDNLKDAIDTYIHQLQVIDLYQKGRTAASELQAQADKNAADAAAKRAKADEELLNQLIKSSMANEKFSNQAENVGLLNLEIALSDLKNIELAYAESYQALNDVFFNPLQESLNKLLTTGKLTFQEFANSVVASITRIMTKLITTKIIQLLTNLLVPGAGLIASAGLSTVGTSALGEFLSNTGGTANFGGIQGGGLGMSGQVNVVLRGSDLIGAINRTNSQIKRVG